MSDDSSSESSDSQIAALIDQQPAASKPRNKLGIGSKFGRSADGRLEFLPVVDGIEEDSDSLLEAGGALQGVSLQAPSRSFTLSQPTSSDSLNDTLVVSKGEAPSRRKGHANKLYSIEDEADLAAGRVCSSSVLSAAAMAAAPAPAVVPKFQSQDGSTSLGSNSEGRGAGIPASSSLASTSERRGVKIPASTSLASSDGFGNTIPVSTSLASSEGLESRIPASTSLASCEALGMGIGASTDSLTSACMSSDHLRRPRSFPPRNDADDKHDKEKPKKPELTERERALLAQIRELERQLAKEKHRKKEQAKVSHDDSRRRLVICSQWMPYKLFRGKDGLLKVGEPHGQLAAYESIRRLDVTWVGCPPVSVPIAERALLSEQLEAKRCVAVFADSSVIERAEGLASEVLWPLFHYIPLSMLDSDTDMIHKQWEGYKELNVAFKQAVLQLVRPNDLVWVHDYYLMLLPAMLREGQPKMKIGWFLHTPFPSSEIYVTLPLRKEILRGVLAANLIGFQIYDYVRHFMTACSRVLGTDINVESTYILDSLSQTAVTVDAFPTGINVTNFDKMLESAELKDKVIELQRRFDGKKLLLGVDRMDYIKGIPHKLIALEKFLDDNPQWAERVLLVQIATPPRGDTSRYQKLRNKVHKLVGSINGRFGTLEHAPIHYLDRPVSTCEMCALCFLADTALITSLREGMSKVAFEYIACQRRGNRGVLVLSEFAGAAQTLGSGAILVNPFNTDEVSSAIYQALHMPEVEREARLANMVEYVNKFTLQFWADDFVTELLTQEQEHEMLTLAIPSPLPRADLLESYSRHSSMSSRRLLVFGLLGTLIDYRQFMAAEPLQDNLWKDLVTLANDPRNVVVIASGRERALCSQFLSDAPVWIVAENGVWYRLGPRSTEWQSLIDPVDDSWLASIKPVFKYFEERTPNSFTEIQEHTITWHYRGADDDFGEIQASDLQMHLEKVLGNQPVEVFIDSKMVQVRPYGVSKGAALDAIMEACTSYSNGGKSKDYERESARHERESRERESGPREAVDDIALVIESDEEDEVSLDFALCVGTHCMRDEDIFGNLVKDPSKDGSDGEYADYLPDPESAWTCTVGSRPSQARFYVEDEQQVAALVSALASRSQAVVQSPLTEPVPMAESPGGNDSLPSPLDNMSAIAGMVGDKRLAFFLDYDGTLTPIVENPWEATLTEETRNVVRELAYRYPTAIVSGRARVTAQNLVAINSLYYAGSHGFDIAGPLSEELHTPGGGSIDERAESSITYRVADSFRPALEEAKAKVEHMLSHIKGVLVEDNLFSVSVHYRMVAEGSDREAVDAAVDSVVSDLPMLRRSGGKMVYELRPSVDWNKGKAVEWLLEQIKKETGDNIFPIYIGDDVTDEDAFTVMNDLGGVGIIVSETTASDATAASFALRNPAEVRQFLRHFASGSVQHCRRAETVVMAPRGEPKTQLLPPPFAPISRSGSVSGRKLR